MLVILPPRRKRLRRTKRLKIWRPPSTCRVWVATLTVHRGRSKRVVQGTHSWHGALLPVVWVQRQETLVSPGMLNRLLAAQVVNPPKCAPQSKRSVRGVLPLLAS